MLRITTQEAPKKITLKLEGELTGVWVSEVCDAWRVARRALNDRVLVVDLSAVERVDAAGQYLLALAHCNGTQLIGSGLIADDLKQTIARDWPPVAAVNVAPASKEA